ncbi:hypothetical protein NLJ89_g9501 [Agrocybe chaxingu]|uniref:Uncharacterized protein n=1 Tax=Agrocybe chaxingu TaxID=84603 RepID=A0A9W8JQN6_9AGAR|nr:hypothetical protein NLJ89_g9501 [Agrocybe chaxingu]
MNPATRAFIIDDTHSDIEYHGRWETKSDSSVEPQPNAPYRGSYRTLKGARSPKGNLSFAFSGSSVVVYGAQFPANHSEKGKVFKCNVDGQEMAYYPKGRERWNSMHQPLCGTDTLADGPHVFDLLISFPELRTSNYSLSFESLAYVPSGNISTSDKNLLIDHTDPEIRSALSPNSWNQVPGLGYMAADNSSRFEMAFVGESLGFFGFYLANVSSTVHLIGYACDLLLFRTERYNPGEHTLLVKGSGAVDAQLTVSYIVVNTGSIAAASPPAVLPSSSISSSSSLLPPTLISQPNLPITGRQVPNMHIGEILGKYAKYAEEYGPTQPYQSLSKPSNPFLSLQHKE